MMSPDPRISVCIPAYNAVAYLRAAVRSVLDQTYQDFEIVIVDDASWDGTMDSIRDLSDPRIRRFSNPSNLGGGANWDRAVERSHGRLIKLLCSDDLLYPSCLEEQVRILDDARWADVGLVCCWRDVIDARGRRLLSRKSPGLQGYVPRRKALRKIVRSGTNPLGEPAAVLFRRELLEKTGPFDGSNPFVLDINMWSRMLLHSGLYLLPKTLCAFRVSPESWSVRLARSQSQSYRQWIAHLYRDPRYGLTRRDLILGQIRSTLWKWARIIFYKRIIS